MQEATPSYLSKIMEENLITDKPAVADLSEREIAFLQLACTDLPYKAFAPLMQVNPRMVETTRDKLFRKLEVRSRVGLAVYAVKNGIHRAG